MNLPPGWSISVEEWEQTPLSVQAMVVLLWQANQTLQQQVATLQAEVEKLREQVQKNSQNSSKPPSTDPPQSRKYPKPEPSGRKPGGQPGHAGKGRQLKPPEQVSRVVKSLPTAVSKAGTLWLDKIVLELCQRVAALFPSLELFKKMIP